MYASTTDFVHAAGDVSCFYCRPFAPRRCRKRAAITLVETGFVLFGYEQHIPKSHDLRNNTAPTFSKEFASRVIKDECVIENR